MALPKRKATARSSHDQDVPVVRGAAVVDAVIGAAFEELDRNGFGGLSIEAVAERAGVNKTTVYRRWPTRSALVQAALLSPRFLLQVAKVPQDTGSFQGDLVALGRQTVRFLASIEGRVALRLGFMERGNPELQFLRDNVKPLSEASLRMPEVEVMDRAIARGEVPCRSNLQIRIEAYRALLLVRILQDEHAATEPRLQELVRALFADVGVPAGTPVQAHSQEEAKKSTGPA